MFWIDIYIEINSEFFIRKIRRFPAENGFSYQMHQILNLYSIGIEIMNGVAGSMGIILTVPFTAAITVCLFKKTRY